MSLVRLKQLDQDGAADNQVVTWDAASQQWIPTTKTAGLTKHLFAAAAGSNYTARGAFGTVQVGTNGAFRGNIRVPGDFGTLVVLEVLGIPVASFTAQDIDKIVNYAQDGELFNQNTGADLVSTYSGTADVIQGFDFSGLVGALTAEDNIGLELDHNGIGTSIGYIGIHMEYVAI